MEPFADQVRASAGLSSLREGNRLTGPDPATTAITMKTGPKLAIGCHDVPGVAAGARLSGQVSATSCYAREAPVGAAPQIAVVAGSTLLNHLPNTRPARVGQPLIAEIWIGLAVCARRERYLAHPTR